MRSIHNTIIKFADIFDGFPIYFINAYDYRLRMYPWNYMFSRTSGLYKYLLIEKESYVNDEGVLTMIKAYYRGDADKLNEIDKLKNKNRKNLLKHFKRYDFEDELKDDSFIYLSLLGSEIESLENNRFKSGFLLEIDYL